MTRQTAQAPLAAPERLTVESAASLLERIRARVAEGGELRIDLAAVVAADTAGLQLLAVVCKALREAGGECHLLRATEPVLQGADLLGIGHMLALERHG